MHMREAAISQFRGSGGCGIVPGDGDLATMRAGIVGVVSPLEERVESIPAKMCNAVLQRRFAIDCLLYSHRVSAHEAFPASFAAGRASAGP